MLTGIALARARAACPARLKVLVVTSYFGNCAPGGIGGGVAIRYRHYVRALRARRHDVRVLSPALGTLPAVVARSSIGYPGHRNAVPSPHAIGTLRRGVRWADVVVFNDLEVTPQLAYICAVEKRPALYSIHTDLRAMNPNPIIQRVVSLHSHVQALVARCSQRCYTTSRSFCDDLRKAGISMAGYYEPVDTSLFLTSRPSKESVAAAREWMSGGNAKAPLLLYAGRWSREKRIDLVISARPPGVQLCIVGDGPVHPQLLAAHAPAGGVVVRQQMFAQDKLAVLFRAADAVVSACGSETFGNVSFEANHCGTPTILQHAPGHVDQITEGENGFLIDWAAADARDVVQGLMPLCASMSRERVVSATKAKRHGDVFVEVVERIALDAHTHRARTAGGGAQSSEPKPAVSALPPAISTAAADGSVPRAVLTQLFIVAWLFRLTTLMMIALDQGLALIPRCRVALSAAATAARRVSKEATPPSVRLLERKRELDAKVEDARRHLALLLKERADLEKHLNTGLEVEKALEAAAHC